MQQDLIEFGIPLLALMLPWEASVDLPTEKHSICRFRLEPQTL